jgi:hypothetical protein
MNIKTLMFVANTETICPNQTREKPNMPVGRFVLHNGENNTADKNKQPSREGLFGCCAVREDPRRARGINFASFAL